MDEVADSNSVAPTIFSPSDFSSRRAFLCLCVAAPVSGAIVGDGLDMTRHTFDKLRSRE